MLRVIRKYPNRRLYDTAESRYITLADVRDLVMQGLTIQVVDKSSGKDITRCILLQVISEQESRDEPLLGRTFLSRVIRAHGRVAPAQLRRHLASSLEAWMAHQDGESERVRKAAGGAAGRGNTTDRQNVG